MTGNLNNITGVLPIGPDPVLVLSCDGTDPASLHRLISDVMGIKQIHPKLRVHVCVLHASDHAMVIFGLLTALNGLDEVTCTFEALDLTASEHRWEILERLPLYRANLVIQNTGRATVLFKRYPSEIIAPEVHISEEINDGLTIDQSGQFCVAAGPEAAELVITKSAELHPRFVQAIDNQAPDWPLPDPFIDQGHPRNPDPVEPKLLKADTLKLVEAFWHNIGTGPRVLVFTPPVDLSFQLTRLATFETRRQVMEGALAPLREAWHVFANRLVRGLESEGAAVIKLTIPLWFMTPTLINYLNPAVAVTPHRQPSQMEGVVGRTWFFMQVFFQFLFTCDPKGWGPWASHYPVELGDTNAGDPPLLDELNTRLLAQNASKFAQPQRISRAGLIDGGLIPEEPFIFFPCQIPHDEQIRFFSDIPLLDLVSALAAWANKSGVHVVFKGHPMNPNSMAPLQKAAPNSTYVRWVNASIHDLIEQAAAVYTLNSGTGLEAILHGKPVVTFAQTEYDCISIQGDINDLDVCWQAVDSYDHDTAVVEHEQFLNKLFGTVGYDVEADWEEEQPRYEQLARRILYED